MTNRVKYPRTMHLPWSEGIKSDDRVIESLDAFIGQRVIVTEKMDGENTTMYQDYIHARSIDSRHHYSRDWIKQFHSSIKHNIPLYFRICGENLYAKHSIHYTNLPSYFMGFSIWEGQECLAWDETTDYFNLLTIKSVPVLYDGIFDEKKIKSIWKNLQKENTEGYVIRVAGAFNLVDFDKKIAKFVRKDHVQTDEHWMYGKEIEKNILTDN